MARLQILELPEGAGDERPPFALVVDQVDDEAADEIARWPDDIASRMGARQVLCFGGTIDIPANEIARQVEPLFRVNDSEGDQEILRLTEERDELHAEIGLAHGQLHSAALSAIRGKHANIRELIGRAEQAEAELDVRKRVAKEQKAVLLDALGMDRVRDWDDIVNSARGLRAVHAAGEAAIERVRLSSTEPEVMNAQQEHPTVWLHGYECGVLAAKSALRPRDESTTKPTDA